MIKISWIEQESYLVWKGEDEKEADKFCKKLKDEGLDYCRVTMP